MHATLDQLFDGIVDGQREKFESRGKVTIGTVKGDLHDIGGIGHEP